MILRCGRKSEQDHFESEGRLYGIAPFAHCDTDCPHNEGTCGSNCSHLTITERPCLGKDYKREKIKNESEANEIIEKVEERVKRGERLTDQQRDEVEFAKISLSEIKKRKSP